MSRRKKIIFGLFGALIGLCIGTLLRNYRTLELISVCNLKVNAKLQSEYITTYYYYYKIRFSYFSRFRRESRH